MIRFLCVAALAVVPHMVAEDFVCPVTKPPNPPFVPPAPYEVTPETGAFWYGTPDLWTQLPTNGSAAGLPHRADGFGDKLFLWQRGYDERKDPKPDITLVVRRLDAQAPRVTSHGGTNAFFGGTWKMLTGITYPTEGCWETTASHDGYKLTFVLSIKP